VMVSFIAFVLVYGLLGAVGYYLIVKHIQQGPRQVNSER
jgi:cytochrome d ubiquinol oxidase subunit I